MPTIGLCMIVKNESNVIERCLDSVRPLIDFVLVEDTGSTDGTQDKIRAWLAANGVDGEVIEEPWVNFAHNRSSALAALRRHPRIDYAFIMDADDTLETKPGFDPAAFKASLTADLYFAYVGSQGKLQTRPQFCRNDRDFLYRGVLHEFLDTQDRAMSHGPGTLVSATADGFVIHSGREGARNLNPHKYRDDARVLAHALKSEPDPFLRSRYTFYLANSLWDAGEKKRALKVYEDRTAMGYWREEIYICWYHAAQLKIDLGAPEPDIVGTFLRAYDIIPHRAEALHGAARFCRTKERWHEAYLFAKAAQPLTCPDDGLHLRPWIYDHGIRDELAVAASWTGRHAECLALCDELLASPHLPADQADRIRANAAFARARLAEATPAAPP